MTHIPKCQIVHASEPQKSHQRRLESGIYKRYLSGTSILDIGGGYGVSLITNAISVDLDYPGYDGITLPFFNCSQDAVFSSHCLEHVSDPIQMIREWFRVVKVNGHLVLVVPHQYLYERKLNLPSRWNKEHQRFYTPASLLNEIESALEMNTYRVRSLLDNDVNFDYGVDEYQHASGCYEIEVVIEKISEEPKVSIGLSALKESLKADRVKDVVICGAGKIGDDIYQMSEELGINIHTITDKNSQLFRGVIQTLPIKDIININTENFIVASVAYRDEITKELKILAKRLNVSIHIYYI